MSRRGCRERPRLHQLVPLAHITFDIGALTVRLTRPLSTPVPAPWVHHCIRQRYRLRLSNNSVSASHTYIDIGVFLSLFLSLRRPRFVVERGSTFAWTLSSCKRAHTISVNAVRGSLIFHIAGFFSTQISLPPPHRVLFLRVREKILPNIFSFAASIDDSAGDRVGGREGRIFRDESQPTRARTHARNYDKNNLNENISTTATVAAADIASTIAISFVQRPGRTPTRFYMFLYAFHRALKRKQVSHGYP